jgi:hypothetical protein
MMHQVQKGHFEQIDLKEAEKKQKQSEVTAAVRLAILARANHSEGCYRQRIVKWWKLV